jgi:hypothetical protein
MGIGVKRREERRLTVDSRKGKTERKNFCTEGYRDTGGAEKRGQNGDGVRWNGSVGMKYWWWGKCKTVC